MSFKFAWPLCKRTLSVKEQFAGERGAAPHCKKVLTVPAPTSARSSAPVPAVDAEALAAQVLGEQQAAAAAPTPEPQTVDFNCPQCDAQLHLPAEVAGKQSPCPACKRIIRVPQLVKNEPKDWRKTGPRLPSGAKQNLEPAPEGAWGTATGAATVSAEALEEAQALPQVREPLTLRQWIFRIGVPVGAAVVLLVGGMMVWNLLTANKQERAVAAACAAAKAGLEVKPATVSREAAAEVYRAA